MMLLTVAHYVPSTFLSLFAPPCTLRLSPSTPQCTRSDALSLFLLERKMKVLSRFILKRYRSQYQAVGVVKQVIRAKCVYDSTHINWYL